MSPRSVEGADPPPDHGHHDEEMPRLALTRSQVLVAVLFVLSAVAFLYFVLPQITGLKDTWSRLEKGDPLWLIVAGILELLSFVGYVVKFRIVCLVGEQDHQRIGWRVSYQITMAGLAATRLFAAAGAGGIALTAWALRRSGMPARVVAVRMVAMNVLLYGVYMSTIVVTGTLLYLGVLSGGEAVPLTILPAGIALLLLLAVGALVLLPADAERRFGRWAAGGGQLQRVGKLLVTVPAAASSGVRTAIEITRERPAALGGSIAWWGFDMATLWACFHAFSSGDTPPIGVIIMSYFVGMAGNLLPLPGGIGGVEGGMIGMFAAFGVDFGYATVAVLSYRAFSFWLPTIPGAIAYVQLRGTVKRWRTQDIPASVAEQPGAASA
jgi:uncharacterized protein (TIRG00374 family)